MEWTVADTKVGDPKVQSPEVQNVTARLFSELAYGAEEKGAAFILNTGDVGLLRALDNVSAEEASHSVAGGASLAAHATHVSYGLGLMNRWARAGGNPFADARWEEAWKIHAVDAQQWDEIRHGLRIEAGNWLETLRAPREATSVELQGMIASVAHLAYHMGAMRQISTALRGPKDGAYD
jgi:hypothetical protein